MLDQVLRDVRLGAAFEIGGSAHHRHAEVGADPQGDHILVDLLTQPHACVVAICDDVLETVITDDLDVDVGILGQERGKGRPEDGLGGVLDGGDADGPGGLVAHGAEGGDLAFDLVEAGADAVKEALARLGQGNASRRAGEEAQPQAGLQCPDRVAERGLGHAKLRRRLREALLAGDRDEGREIIHVVPAHSEIRFLSPCR